MGKKSKNKNVTPTTKLVTPCHYGNVNVANKPFPIYAGGWSRGFHVVKNSIILDLADVVREPKILFWNMNVPESLNDRYTTDASVIRIQWPDGGVPTLNPSFWYKIADYLVEENRTVIVCCMGGHGRTGTALAILAGIYGLHGTADVGEWVRANHCAKAIETYSQVDYIEEVTGERTSIVPSWANELNAWKTTKTTVSRYSPFPIKVCEKCGCEIFMESTVKCFKCNSTDLADVEPPSTVTTDEQKVFGWFDKNDVYHAGTPTIDDDVDCLVGQDEYGNDVFEYIYDKNTDDFLPTK